MVVVLQVFSTHKPERNHAAVQARATQDVVVIPKTQLSEWEDTTTPTTIIIITITTSAITLDIMFTSIFSIVAANAAFIIHPAVIALHFLTRKAIFIFRPTAADTRHTIAAHTVTY